MVIQQLIQSRLFHLISMLICIGVVVWLLARRYSRSENGSEKSKIQTLNTIYISGILVFIIIELVTAICMGNASHADILSFVSFAATLSSLILSVVAIIFTIVSGNRGDAQYQKLDKVSEDVRTSLSKFSDKTSKMDQSIESFQSIADGLTKQMHDIYEKLSGIEKPISEIREQMTLNEQAGKVDGKQKDGVRESFKTRVENYISIGSYSGNLVLYACVLSKEKSKDFNMSEISNSGEDQAYKYGYLISSSAMGVLSINASEERRIKVLYCHENLKGLLESAIKSFIDNSPDENTRKINNDQLNMIKRVFDVL